MQTRFSSLAAMTALALAAILAWDLAGLDLALAHASGGAAGFPLREDWFLTTVMHSGARYLAWALEMGLCAMVIWPLGPFRALEPARRLRLAATVVLASGMVAALKAFNHTSCPWDLQEFGGVATQLPHWVGWLTADGGGGRCFPAGHATAGFAFLGGWFAFRDPRPGLARAWLLAALAAGLLLGIGQQVRGAHFFSHTLWSGWLCWVVAWAVDSVPWGADGEGEPA